MSMDSSNKSIVFAVGTGRCGTNFLHKVFSSEPEVVSYHERHPLEDTFHRFVKFHDLPIDDEGFLAVKEQGIMADIVSKKVYFESNAHLSLSIKELHERFGAKFIYMVRSPHKVVNSFIQKGWYEQPVIRKDVNKISNVQPNRIFPHHNFSRIVPVGDEGTKWESYSQVGKDAWFWKTINERVLEQLSVLPKDSYEVIRLEDMNFQKFKALEKMFGIAFHTDEKTFDKLVKTRPNKLNPQRTVASWNDKESEEFMFETKNLASHFNYEVDLSEIIKKEIKKEVETKTFFSSFFK